MVLIPCVIEACARMGVRCMAHGLREYRTYRIEDYGLARLLWLPLMFSKLKAGHTGLIGLTPALLLPKRHGVPGWRLAQPHRIHWTPC